MSKRDKKLGRYGPTYIQAERLVGSFFDLHGYLKQAENEARITSAAEDVTFANELMTDSKFEFERSLLWKAVDHCERMDRVISPSALKTDFKRELQANYRGADGKIPLDARCMIGRYSNDHVVTAIVRYIISEDPAYYREYFQVNHATCDLILCALFRDRFKWLLDERLKEAELLQPGSPWLELKNGRAVQLSIFDAFDEYDDDAY